MSGAVTGGRPEAVHVLVLAAGDGKRMHSRVPKVVHPVAGLSIVAHVVCAALALDPASVHVVVCADADPARDALAGYPVSFAIQDPPAGTADAVSKGCEAIAARDGLLLVLNGDSPGIRPETLRRMLEHNGDAAGSFLTVELDDPTGCGRIVRGEEGGLLRIVEEPDATDEQRAISEVNAGVYVFSLSILRGILGEIRADNAQGEFYLTDALERLQGAGHAVRLFAHDNAAELQGINTRADLARAEAFLQRVSIDRLMTSGVTFRDPHRVLVDADVEVGQDTVVYPGVVLEAGTRIGAGAEIRSNVRITRCDLGTGVVVLDGCVLEDSKVEERATLGPYARLRPGSHVGPGAKVGNFVEVKKTRIGAGSKAGHLTYLGDAEIGDGVNIGAGTITCNYDGAKKHLTVIEDGAFIGSNTALVAPVRVGRGAYVGAGSTITGDVPAAALGLARGRQVNKPDWAKENAPRKDDK